MSQGQNSKKYSKNFSDRCFINIELAAMTTSKVTPLILDVGMTSQILFTAILKRVGAGG